MLHPDSLPSTAFIDPHGGNLQAVAELAHGMLDRLLAHLATAATRSPLPDRPLEAAWATFPAEPQPEDELFQRLDALLAGAMNPASPGFIGHMDSLPTTMSLLGDLLASALNNNMLSLEMSPAFSRLEVWLMQALARAFGLGPDSGGVLLSGGTLANLQALAVARNHAFPVLRQGLAGQPLRPVILTSDAAHTSLEKAAMLLGLGTEGVIRLPTDENARIVPATLERAIGGARQEGLDPFCVVATAGTTTTGTIDPLEALGEIARAHGLWYHVDAAYAGALIFSEARARLAGIEGADSITWNPQKWLYIAKTCAMALFRDRALLERAFRVPAPYMRPTDGFVNLGELSVQGTRHADVLKLWLSLQHLGQRGYQQLFRHSEALTQSLVTEIRARPFLTLATEPDTNVVCFRATPATMPPAEWDGLNARLQQALLDQASIFLSLPRFRGANWLRAVFLNPYTDEGVIARLCEGIDRFAEANF